MDDIQKMFQIIINGQSAFRQEVLNKFDQLEKRLNGKINGLDEKVDLLEENLTNRLDKLGQQLAYLESNKRRI